MTLLVDIVKRSHDHGLSISRPPVCATLDSRGLGFQVARVPVACVSAALPCEYVTSSLVTKMVTDFLKLHRSQRHSFVLNRLAQRLIALLTDVDTVGVRGSRPLAPTIGTPWGVSDCAIFVFSPSSGFSPVANRLLTDAITATEYRPTLPSFASRRRQPGYRRYC